VSPLRVTPADLPALLRLDGSRPLREWDVSAYIVCHDIKFAGYAKGIVAWAEEPRGGVLDHAIALLVRHLLTSLGDVSPDKQRYDVISVTATLLR
jgi:hypothetical protein